MYALSTVYRTPMPRRRYAVPYDLFQPLARMADDYLSPRERVQETDSAYLLNVELPGYEQSEINVAVKDGSLSIDAEHEGGEDGATRRFHRSFTLDGVNEDAISAAYRNGILTVTLPRQEDMQARTIEIAG